jgi:hypothetical protein
MMPAKVQQSNTESMVIAGTNAGTYRISYSFDGLSWYAAPSANTVFTTAVNAVAYNGQMWVAVGYWYTM